MTNSPLSIAEEKALTSYQANLLAKIGNLTHQNLVWKDSAITGFPNFMRMIVYSGLSLSSDRVRFAQLV